MNFDIKYTFWEKITLPFYRTYHKIESLYYSIKYLLQKLFRGYSDIELWSIDATLAPVILKYLKLFKNMNRQGYPCCMMDLIKIKDEHNPTEAEDKLCREKWNEIIDDMIFSFEYAVGNYSSAEKYHDLIYPNNKEVVIKFVPSEDDPKMNRMVCEPKLEYRRDIYEKLEVKYDKGMMLFSRYFSSLWD